MSLVTTQTAAPPLSGTSPEEPRRAWWRGRVYDVGIAGAAVGSIVLLVWNLFFAAGLQEQRRTTEDRTHLQAEIEQWCAALTAHERALDADCRMLLEITAPQIKQAPAELGLDRVRAKLKESNELLSATSRALIKPEAPRQQAPQSDALRDQVEMLREQYGLLLQRMMPEHPEMRRLRDEIADADQRLSEATPIVAEAQPVGDPNIRVVTNQYFRPVALSKPSPPPVPPAQPNADLLAGLSELETRFQDLRAETERLLVDVERARRDEPSENPARTAAWNAVTLRLSEMEQEFQLPRKIRDLPILAETPREFSSTAIWSALVLGLCAGLGTLLMRTIDPTPRRAIKRSVRRKPEPKPAAIEQSISLDEVSRTLGCTPLVVWRIDEPQGTVAPPHRPPVTEPVVDAAVEPVSKTPLVRSARWWVRRSSETWLAVVAASFLFVALTSREFRSDLFAHPASAWGTHWARTNEPQS